MTGPWGLSNADAMLFASIPAFACFLVYLFRKIRNAERYRVVRTESADGKVSYHAEVREWFLWFQLNRYGFPAAYGALSDDKAYVFSLVHKHRVQSKRKIVTKEYFS